MSNLNINVSNLKDLTTDFEQGYANYLASLNDIYSQIRNAKDFWFDNNADTFVSIALTEKAKTDEYLKNIKGFKQAISDFTDSLSNIARASDVGHVTHIKYKGNNVFKLVNDLNYVQSMLQQLTNQVNNFVWRLPSSFSYSHRKNITNMNRNISSYKNVIGDIGSFYHKLSTNFENSISTLKQRCNGNNIVDLNFQNMEYRGNMVSAVISPLNITDEALNNQDLVAEITQVEYSEVTPNITGGGASLHKDQDTKVEYSEVTPNITGGGASLHKDQDTKVEYSEVTPNINNSDNQSININNAEIHVDNGIRAEYSKAEALKSDASSISPDKVNFNFEHGQGVEVNQGTLNQSESQFNFERGQSVKVNQDTIKGQDFTFNFNKSTE